MTTNFTYIVFTDFDGTITTSDVGDKMFQHFGDAKKCLDHFEMYKNGTIDARECWRKSCATINELSEEMFRGFALEQQIDTSFRTFVDFCASKKIPVIVLSDGFDSYIDPLLKRDGFEVLPRYTNELQFDNGKLTPLFPYSDETCIQCANCKRNHMLTNSSENNIIVYIGDGYSDRCPVRYADIVFAKNSLLTFCEENNITYHRFSTFADVLPKFSELVELKRPKKRLMAEHARKDVYLQG